MTIEIETGADNQVNTSIVYTSVFDDGTVTVSDETSDGPGLNALEDTTNDYWEPGTTSDAYITVDCGDDYECDGYGIAAHTMGTVGATYVIESSPDNSTWTARATGSPLTDETIFGLFPAASERYWRIGVSGGLCLIGVVKLGKRLVFPTAPLIGHVGSSHAKRIEFMRNKSIGGHFIGNRIIRTGGEMTINMGLVDRSFVENDMAVFETWFDEARGFFYAGDPTELPDDVAYCMRSGGEIRPSYSEGGDLMPISMDVDFYV